MEPEVVTKSYTLFPSDVEIIEKVNNERGLLNSSAALRMIIREWEELSRVESANNNGKGGQS